MVQEVGVNSFSYGALAAEIGVSAPSIHHHFRTKDDLVAAVAARYRASFNQRLVEIAGEIGEEIAGEAVADGRERGKGAVGRLHAYAQLFAETSSKELMCFCGSLSSDWASVGNQARREVSLFFEDQVEWVASQIGSGVAARELRSVDARATATAFVAALEGAMLMARSAGDRRLPHKIAATFVDGLVP